MREPVALGRCGSPPAAAPAWRSARIARVRRGVYSPTPSGKSAVPPSPPGSRIRSTRDKAAAGQGGCRTCRRGILPWLSASGRLTPGRTTRDSSPRIARITVRNPLTGP